MKFERFSINAIPIFTDAYCKCGNNLVEVSNGLLSRALFCKKCKSVYKLELRKVSKKYISKEFLLQCEKESKMTNKKYCEWREIKDKYGDIARIPDCKDYEFYLFILGFNYCPYCGKPIKIKEVSNE